MKLIVGLGNPGREYADTRHNLGYAVLDRLAERWTIEPSNRRKFSGRLGEGRVADQRVALLWPTTYMNRSGRSVQSACAFYKVEPPHVLVVLDDLDLPVGKLRMRRGGSAGGHKGLTDVLLRLGDTDVPRLRLGIGKVDSSVTVDHVLSRFADDELTLVRRAIDRAADGVECWLREGVEAAMNEFNRPEADASE
jgi:PTH1 family peptidyl-tRNA hydrolase